MTFDEAVQRVIAVEGGYVNDPRDPGGETKYGISRRAYPGEDIAALSVERAKELYRRDYWGPAGCDAVPEALRFHLFDMAVHSGARAAIRALQAACGASVDGVLGPRTLLALSSCEPLRLVARLCGQRLALMTRAAGWDAFGRGWARRLADNLIAS